MILCINFALDSFFPGIYCIILYKDIFYSIAFGGIPPLFVFLYPVKSVLSIHFVILS